MACVFSSILADSPRNSLLLSSLLPLPIQRQPPLQPVVIMWLSSGNKLEKEPSTLPLKRPFLAALTYPGSLVKMWNFRLHPRSTISKSVFQQDPQVTHTWSSRTIILGTSGKGLYFALKGTDCRWHHNFLPHPALNVEVMPSTASTTLNKWESKSEV